MALEGLAGALLGGEISLFSMLVLEVFGRNNFKLAMTRMAIVRGFATAIGPLLGYYLYLRFINLSSQAHFPLFYLCSALSFVAACGCHRRCYIARVTRTRTTSPNAGQHRTTLQRAPTDESESPRTTFVPQTVSISWNLTLTRFFNILCRLFPTFLLLEDTALLVSLGFEAERLLQH